MCCEVHKERKKLFKKHCLNAFVISNQIRAFQLEFLLAKSVFNFFSNYIDILSAQLELKKRFYMSFYQRN